MDSNAPKYGRSMRSCMQKEVRRCSSRALKLKTQLSGVEQLPPLSPMRQFMRPPRSMPPTHLLGSLSSELPNQPRAVRSRCCAWARPARSLRTPRSTAFLRRTPWYVIYASGNTLGGSLLDHPHWSGSPPRRSATSSPTTTLLTLTHGMHLTLPV